ncbi:hypothetical protein B9Z55_018081 [Caenorhabditis nigoni]|nr:hypothetical protein B9Z55_018081 [Caenorhabditis nigoni]
MYFVPKGIHRADTIKKLHPPLGRPLKAFILSAYFYPYSKSLGNNSLAIVMSMNLKRNKENFIGLQYGELPDTTEIEVLARNKTTAIVVKTNYQRITPHDNCLMVTVFATLQLLPDTEFIAMVSGVNMTMIPFKTPSYQKRDVVVCISPLYVTEQWQNFLLAVHILKK